MLRFILVLFSIQAYGVTLPQDLCSDVETVSTEAWQQYNAAGPDEKLKMAPEAIQVLLGQGSECLTRVSRDLLISIGKLALPLLDNARRENRRIKGKTMYLQEIYVGENNNKFFVRANELAENSRSLIGTLWIEKIYRDLEKDLSATFPLKSLSGFAGLDTPIQLGTKVWLWTKEGALGATLKEMSVDLSVSDSPSHWGILFTLTPEKKLPQGNAVLSVSPFPSQTWEIVDPNTIQTEKGTFRITNNQILHQEKKKWKTVAKLENVIEATPFVDIDGDGVPEFLIKDTKGNLSLRRFFPHQDVVLTKSN